MSKHVWLVRPSAQRAAVVAEAYLFAARAGADPGRAAVFAGYYAETVTQKGANGPRGPEDFWEVVSRAGHRYLRGRNADNYRRVWSMHVREVLRVSVLELAGALPDGHRLPADVPWGVLADMLEDLGDGPAAAALRFIGAAWEELKGSGLVVSAHLAEPRGGEGGA